MSTYDMPLMEYVTRRMGAVMMRRRERRSLNLPRTWIQSLVRLTLHIAGFSCFTIAGFSVSLPAGLIVAGVSCLILSYLSTKSDAPHGPSTMTGR